MITEEEYLKAKAIVEQYEREELEQHLWHEGDDLDQDYVTCRTTCETCGSYFDNHALNCPDNDSPMANLVQHGYA